MQSRNGRRGAKFQRVVLSPGFIQQQLRLIPFMEKKNSLRCKVSNPVRLHILLVTLHAPASCENKFFQSMLCTVMQEVAITILSPYR